MSFLSRKEIENIFKEETESYITKLVEKSFNFDVPDINDKTSTFNIKPKFKSGYKYMVSTPPYKDIYNDITNADVPDFKKNNNNKKKINQKRLTHRFFCQFRVL